MPKTALLLGASMTLGLAGPASAQDAGGEGRFLEPVQVESASGPINLRAATQGVPRSGHGHAGPHAADLDDDGTPDLLVGDIFGNVFFYKGLGTEAGTRFAAGELLRRSDGELLVFKNW